MDSENLTKLHEAKHVLEYTTYAVILWFWILTDPKSINLDTKTKYFQKLLTTSLHA